MKSLVVQWVNVWCTEARTWEQVVTSREMVLKVPIYYSIHALPEPSNVIFLG